MSHRNGANAAEGNLSNLISLILRLGALFQKSRLLDLRPVLRKISAIRQTKIFGTGWRRKLQFKLDLFYIDVVCRAIRRIL